MRSLIEANFGIVLLLSCVVGLLVPSLQAMPDASASVALALLTYASCFKLSDGGFSQIKWKHVGVFYILRYVLMPALLFAVAHIFFPLYATGMFLLAVLPTAVSSPAFGHMFGGNVPTSFAIVIISTLLAPFLIPLQFSWMGDVAVAPSPYPLFKTLAFCVFTPMVFYFATRNHKKWAAMMYVNVKIISIVLVFFVIALVIAKQRDVILADPVALIEPLLLTITCYGIFISSGWWLSRKEPTDVRISYTACSVFNNVALGVSVALLHFPPNVVLFIAASEIGWALVPTMLRSFLRFQAK